MNASLLSCPYLTDWCKKPAPWGILLHCCHTKLSAISFPFYLLEVRSRSESCMPRTPPGANPGLLSSCSIPVSQLFPHQRLSTPAPFSRTRSSISWFWFTFPVSQFTKHTSKLNINLPSPSSPSNVLLCSQPCLSNQGLCHKKTIKMKVIFSQPFLLCMGGVWEKQELLPAVCFQSECCSAEQLNAFQVLTQFAIKVEADMCSPSSKGFFHASKVVIQNSYSLALFPLML